MMKQLLLFLFCLLPAGLRANADTGKQLKVLQLNVWQDATQVDGAFEAIADEVAAHRPDIVTLCEVRDYHGVHFTDSLCRSLRGKGLLYYTCPSKDGGILSRYPIVESGALDSVSINRAVIDVEGRQMAVYAVHLDYTHYACDVPRGYDGVTWKECPLPAAVEEVLAQNDASQRPRQIRIMMRHAEKDIEKGMPVVVGGGTSMSLHGWTGRRIQRTCTTITGSLCRGLPHGCCTKPATTTLTARSIPAR